MAKDFGIGEAVKRKEDVRFLTGKGKYTDDMNRPDQTYVYFLRSPVAHATLNSINTDAASSAPGVVRIFTGQDIVDAGLGGVPCGWGMTDKHGEPQKEPPHPILSNAIEGKKQLIGPPGEGPRQTSELAVAIESQHVAYPMLPKLGKGELQHRECARLVGNVGHDLGYEAGLKHSPAPVCWFDNRLLKFIRGKRCCGDRRIPHQLGKPRVTKRSIVEIGSQGEHHPQT